ncbi:MAG: DUF192 domain-containing protein [Phycisphaeraceae bacterium]|nr:DUF192 domain-containing protein [Phycisphaeraceae bacterium]
MKMGFRRVALAVLAAVLVSCLPACGNGGEPATKPGGDTAKAPAELETIAFPIKGKAFTLELAIDGDARTQGLSDRKSIADDGGMLFVFPSPVKTQFVMRRCYVPIDLIFIDEDGYIDSLHAMEVIEPVGGARWKNPFTGYSTAGSILYAVELQGGKIAELGLKQGEKLELPEAVLQLKAQ